MRFLEVINQKFASNDFGANVAILASGTIAGRVILVLAMPVLTRLYSPEDFELLAVYMSILAILTVVAALRLDLAIPIIKDDTDAINTLALAVLFATLIGCLLLLAVLLFPTELASFIGSPDFKPFLWMIPVGIFFGSVYQSVQYWTSRQRRFRLVSRTRVERAVGGAGAQIGLGMMGVSMAPFGLLFGQVIYNALGVFGLLRDIVRQDRDLVRSIHWSIMQRNIRQHRLFPLYSVPEALMNAAGTQIPVLIIAASAHNSEAGYLLLAMQVITMPLALIGRSVGQVFLAEAADRHQLGTLAEFTRSTAKKLVTFGAPPLIAIGLLAPFLFGFIFGEGWERAGVLVAWSVPWAIFQFVSSPLSTALHSTGRIGLAMILQGFGLLLRVGAVVVAANGFPMFIAEVYALSSALFYAAYIGVIISVTR
jgi:O-antigen/teichoic acid export membrane protein